ncbi:MAG TPA: sigma-70 family RNA polymerase sigma factor [Candidatus Dormibacteraeota bacterium]|nr:sigma-70 family RNA polymerase sigma factor [Candidatus Dormibacteraeota bacterium]
MAQPEALGERFESQRTRLRAIAYRMLGSLSEAEDAVQETWLRFAREGDEIRNLPAWLTTVVTRICLNVLQARRVRREEPLVEGGGTLPEVSMATLDPEHEAVLADSVGLALQVVLDALSPPERVAFVLHDLFSVPFDDIAEMVGRSTVAVRQLASRGRRRVAGRPVPDSDLTRQWDVVGAYYAAARDGDFHRLLELLDPDVVLRMEGGAAPGASRLIHGATEVAKRSSSGARAGRRARMALVNGTAGAVIFEGDHPVAVLSYTVVGSRIVEIEILNDPEQLRRL